MSADASPREPAASAAAVRARLAALPRTPLANLPTPLLPARRLAASLDGRPEVLVKMDAETGFALGGNKVRKLEHELSPERLEGVTCLVTAGGPQSNHCRVTAAAAARLGLRCVLVVNGPPPAGPPRGNALLHRLFGAEIHVVEDRALRAPTMEDVARREAEAGGRALVVPLGASTPVGALGYARAAAELDAQLPADGRPVWVFVASSSCGTLGGLAAAEQGQASRARVMPTNRLRRCRARRSSRCSGARSGGTNQREGHSAAARPGM
ncbi:MAG: pyridoxal-phosphate dependent enzyme [Gemmatimonadetes bacterium]|nr:pyridoxal-phosphate dependent enzyme [Gemmatimonadota bacterium]